MSTTVTLPYSITKDIEFDAGHRVPYHASKCRSPHGHRYKVRAELACEELIQEGEEAGMVKDFGFLKEMMTRLIHDVLDHGFIVWEQDTKLLAGLLATNKADDPDFIWKVVIFPYIPTAENIARWCYDELEDEITQEDTPYVLTAVTLWETPTSVARYAP